MIGIEQRYPSVVDVISTLQPREPVYCIYPKTLQQDVVNFVDGFPGRVMYAVKANPAPPVINQVMRAGVTDFDTASVVEMQDVHALDENAKCYFMAPVRLRGAVETAYREHGVRHYVVDHSDELRRVMDELPARDNVEIFVRMVTDNPDATYNLSEKFGATADDTARILREVADAGMQPALAFNTGSLVRQPDAYVAALEKSAAVLEQAGIAIKHLDVGGGFPCDYPDMNSAPLQQFFDAIRSTKSRLAALRDIELLAEPGRALIARGMSLLVSVLHRNGDRLYLNDGIWGSMIEPVLSAGKLRYPARVYRNGTELGGGDSDFSVFGPTCDSMDRLPAPLPLPSGIAAGDWIEFSSIGAYSLSNRTHFNGFYPDAFVEIDGAAPLA